MKRELNYNEKAHTSKKRMFLSALLIAVLGSNYYFQVSSSNTGMFELAQKAEEKKDKSETEGKAGTPGACTTEECRTSALPKNQAEFQAAIAKAVEVALAEKEKKAKEEADKKAKEEANKLSPKEKREKLAQENKDKEKKEKEERNAEFEERMEEIADSCKGDVECSIGQFNTLLGRFTGKKKIDSAVVTKAFNRHIAKDLKAALRSSDSADTVLSAIHSLTAEIPHEYRQLKEKTVDIVRNDGAIKAMEVNRGFQMADQLTKAKRPVEASQYFNEALQKRDAFAYSTDLIYQSMVGGVNEASDNATLDYIRRTYMPDMRKLLTSMSDVKGINVSNLSDPATTASASTSASISATLTQPTQQNQNPPTTRNNNRGSSTETTSQNATTNFKPGLLQGVSFGKPSSSPQLQRTGRSN